MRVYSALDNWPALKRNIMAPNPKCHHSGALHSYKMMDRARSGVRSKAHDSLYEPSYHGRAQSGEYK
jgi:hypothetical protein